MQFLKYQAFGTSLLYLATAGMQLLYTYQDYKTLAVVLVMSVAASTFGLTSSGALKEETPTTRHTRRHALIAAAMMFLLLLRWQDSLNPRTWISFGESTSEAGALTTNNSSAELDVVNVSAHPIPGLVRNSQKEFNAALDSQSSTLAAAAQEYRARYGLPPPPHFDQWFEYAKDRDVKIIDNYDIVMDSIRPFWSLKPVKLRERVREAFGLQRECADCPADPRRQGSQTEGRTAVAARGHNWNDEKFCAHAT